MKKSDRKTPRRSSSAPFVPAQVTTTRELAALQRAVWTLISRPLTAGNRMPRRWLDGRPTRAIAAQIAKPNDRLTSVDRLEIYSRVYWFRVLDSLYEDCPGLRAILGGPRFMKLAEAYLAKYPSRSFTLRNLPDRLARFIREQPSLTRPYTALCYDTARFEWARVEVFDTAAFPVFTAADLRSVNPSRLKLNLQPYLQLLKLDHPVDEFILAVKQREELSRGEASNTSLTAPRHSTRGEKLPRPRPARTYVAVHRLNGTTYFKRLEPAGYKILTAIRAGRNLQQALAAGILPARHPRSDWPSTIQGWFQTWMQLGWFCRRE